MNVNKIKELFCSKTKIKFKFYTLDYIIEKTEQGYIIYAEIYQSNKKIYNSLDELFEQYTVYNENIIDNDYRILNIEEL